MIKLNIKEMDFEEIVGLIVDLQKELDDRGTITFCKILDARKTKDTIYINDKR
ncbi:MAG: hypothetical protein AABY22_03020 [Nanoarchaeota archaeon]|mgnify:CR=1 FL=1